LRRPTRERTLQGHGSVHVSLGRTASTIEIVIWECLHSTTKAHPKHIRRGGAVVTLPGRTTYRTILPWMAQETQYCSFRYILGTVYSEKTEASEMSPADG